MKPKYIFITISILLLGFQAFAGNLSEGKYWNESNSYGIIIYGDSALIVRNSSMGTTNMIDTIARASYKYINKDFIKLEGVSPMELITSGAYVLSENKDTVDGIYVEICTPNYDGCFMITYSDDHLKTREVVNNSLFLYKVDKMKESVSFGLENPNPEYNVDGTSWSTFWYSLLVNLDRNKNFHKVVLPNVTENSFKLIETNNDYIRVSGNKLMWRGICFRKKGK